MDTGSTGVRSKRRILLVEDNRDERDMYARRMREAGWEVREITTGVDALEVAAAFQPHVVFMDLRMPELDGASATRQLKQDPRTLSIPIVVISAFIDRSWDAYSAGCHTFLTKPCLPQTVIEILEGILAQGERPAESEGRRGKGG